MASRDGVVARTDRLVLRHWRQDDLEPYISHCNSEVVMEHLGGPRSRRAIAKEVSDLIEQQGDYGFSLWAVEQKSDGEFLGFCGQTNSTISTCKTKITIRFAQSRMSWSWEFAFGLIGGTKALRLKPVGLL